MKYTPSSHVAGRLLLARWPCAKTPMAAIVLRGENTTSKTIQDIVQALSIRFAPGPVLVGRAKTFENESGDARRPMIRLREKFRVASVDKAMPRINNEKLESSVAV